MIYTDWINRIASLLDISATITNASSANPSSVADFNNILPAAIDYSENRIQRDLDLLATRATVSGLNVTLTPQSRFFTLPKSNGLSFLVIEQLNPVVGGVRRQSLIPVSRNFLDTTYPSDFPPFGPLQSVPIYFAMYDDAHVLVGPAPDQNYPIEVVGTVRLAQMSATNTSNFLTLVLPDLYIAASMVFLSGFQRDFGQQSDDPKLALSWEAVYQSLLKPSLVEEFRKKWQGAGWTDDMPSPVAGQPHP